MKTRTIITILVCTGIILTFGLLWKAVQFDKTVIESDQSSYTICESTGTMYGKADGSTYALIGRLTPTRSFGLRMNNDRCCLRIDKDNQPDLYGAVRDRIDEGKDVFFNAVDAGFNFYTNR